MAAIASALTSAATTSRSPLTITISAAIGYGTPMTSSSIRIRITMAGTWPTIRGSGHTSTFCSSERNTVPLTRRDICLRQLSIKP